MFWDYVLFFILAFFEIIIFLIVCSALEYWSIKTGGIIWRTTGWIIYVIPFICLVIAMVFTIEFVLIT